MKRRTNTILFLVLAAAAALHGEEPQFAFDPGRPPTVALVLAGGGALGFAHVGVLELLEELEIPLDIVVGTSMGAIAGGLYTIGYGAADLADIVLGVDWISLLVEPPARARTSFQEHADPVVYLGQADFQRGGSILTPGFISGHRVLNLLRLLAADFTGEMDFDELPRRYRAVAVDISDGSEVILSSGSLVQAMRASMAVPGIFDPVEFEGRLLVDGGVANNFPVDVARQMGADVVIAVNLEPPLLDGESIFGITDMLSQTVNLVIRSNTGNKRELADVLIEPNLDGLNAASFGSGEVLIQRGRDAAEGVRPQLERLAAALGEVRPPAVMAAHPWAREVQLDSLIIRGADRFTEDRIRTALPLGPPIRIEAIHKALDNLTNVAGYESVGWELYRSVVDDGNGDDAIALEIDFVRRTDPFLYLRLGLSYESHFGPLEEQEFTGALQAIASNVVGPGSELAVMQRVGRNLSTRVSFTQPLGTVLAAQVILRHDQLLTTLHELEDPAEQYLIAHPSAGFDLALQLNAGTTVRAGYHFGWASLRQRYGGTVSLEPFDGVVAGVEAAIESDSLNRFPFPDAGSHWNVRYRLVDPALGSDLRYQILDGSYRRYLEVVPRHVVGMYLRGATSFNTELPLWDSVWVGGRQDMTGYYLRELRAQQLALAALEYRWRVGFLSSVLRDRVYLSLRGSVASVDEEELRWGSGIGAGVATPVGGVHVSLALRDGWQVRGFVALGFHF